jgi:hypothetical protein
LRRLLLLLLLSGCASGPGVQAEVDLLTLIDPKRDAVDGTWAFEAGALVTSNISFGRLQIPYAPPEEYDVRLVAERRGPVNSIVLGLVAGGKQFAVVIDAFPRDTMSGVDRVDDKAFPDNETGFKGVLLQSGTPSTIRVAVRKTSLKVTVDGKPVVDWKADWKRVSLYPNWKVSRKDALFLGGWTTPYRILELSLRPASG